MIGVHSGVDIRDDAAPGHLKGVLRFRQADNLCGGLVRIGIPHCCVEIVDWILSNSNPLGSLGDAVLPADDGDYLVPLGRHYAWHAPQNIQESYWIDGVGSSNQEELVQRAIQPANHSATLERANRLEKATPEGSRTINRLSATAWTGHSAQKSRKPQNLLDLIALTASSSWESKSFRPSESPAVSGNCDSSVVSLMAPFDR